MEAIKCRRCGFNNTVTTQEEHAANNEGATMSACASCLTPFALTDAEKATLQQLQEAEAAETVAPAAQSSQEAAAPAPPAPATALPFVPVQPTVPGPVAETQPEPTPAEPVAP